MEVNARIYKDGEFTSAVVMAGDRLCVDGLSASHLVRTQAIRPDGSARWTQWTRASSWYDAMCGLTSRDVDDDAWK